MESKRKHILPAALTVSAIAGLWLGVNWRSDYEEARVRGGDELYATKPAKVTSDSLPVMGGVGMGEYFEIARRLLERESLFSMDNEDLMRHETLRYLIQSLDDIGSQFYDPAEWESVTGIFTGQYKGICADLVVLRTGEEEKLLLPLTIVSVAEGGPAALAGLKSGDQIEAINGQWVTSRSLMTDVAAEYNKLQRKAITQKQFDEYLEGAKQQSESAISLYKAMTLLRVENNGMIKLKVLREGKELEVELLRQSHEVETFEVKGDTIRIRAFSEGVDAKIADAISGKTSITFDIRGCVGGSFAVLEKCLSQLVPAGPYARIRKEPNSSITDLVLNSGKKSDLKITVLVDRGTAREAELFAVALRDRVGATVTGGPTFGLGAKSERFDLKDGSGYTITAEHYYSLDGKPMFTVAPDRPPLNKDPGETQ